MNKMKLSAIVLGIAAAGALAQNAPAAAPAAAPAQPAAAAPAAAPAQPAAPAADAKKAEAAAPAPVANADSVKAAEEAAKKAEEEKAAAEAKKAEEEKAAAEAKKAEEEKAAAEAKKAEEEKAAAEAQKAEEAKTAEAAPAAEDKGEVSAAAGNALDMLKASMNEETSAAKMEVKMSGEVEFDAYTNDVLADGDLGHRYATTADLNIDVKFNDKWSAHLGIEADAGNEAPGFGYNGAFVQYKPADFFAVKFGDLTFSEGAFVAYYGYDDPTYNAAGMKEHDIRGMQIELAGLELGIGFGRNGNDERRYGESFGNGANYNAHLAYEFNYAGQHLRPYVDYKSYQTEEHNELHAGIDAGLTIGGFSFRAVYGFHADFLGDDDDAKSLAGKYDMTSTAHTILAEPTFDVSMFQIKTTFFYAIIDNDGDGDGLRNEVDGVVPEVPEYMFIYAEPALKLAGFIKLGIPVEYHTNTLDDDASVETLDIGGRFYLSPVENLNITAFGMVDIPMGDDNDGEDSSLRFGVETVFSF